MRIELEEIYKQTEDTALPMPGLTKSNKQVGSLVRKFVAAPFSVLDARAHNWKSRKRQWVGLGIKGEEGRNEIETANNICSPQWGRGADSEFYADNPVRVAGHGLSESQGRLNKVRGGRDAGRCFGQDMAKGEHVVRQKGTQDSGATGTSVFDPVLCECIYKWFGKEGGRVLDPFAGGSTRGVVAGVLGLDYTGVDLRIGQVEANRRQLAEVSAFVEKQSGKVMCPPTWLHGDSTNLSEVLDDNFAGDNFDLIWTCPPYYDLEIYSDSQNDGSAKQTYPEFIEWYKGVFAQAAVRLLPNRFAAVCIGEVRKHDGDHAYQDLEVDTVRVFKELGFSHYNRLVLMTPVGSLPIRIASQFPTYRKVGNTHQMVYIFWRGENDHKAIPRELGVLCAEDIGEAEEEKL